MRLLNLFENIRFPVNTIDFVFDHHVRERVRPVFADIWECEREGHYRGENKYRAYADLVSCDLQHIIDVVYNKTEPNNILLDDMGLMLTRIPRKVKVNNEDDITVIEFFYISNKAG